MTTLIPYADQFIAAMIVLCAAFVLAPARVEFPSPKPP